MQDASGHPGQHVPPRPQGARQVPDEPPSFMDMVREKGLSKELLTDEMAEPHVYLIVIISVAILIAIIIAAAGA